MTTTPPGWHTDPDAPGRLRWWDGTQWTAHTHPAGAGAEWVVRGPAPASRTRGWRVWAGATVGALALLGSCTAALGAMSPDPPTPGVTASSPRAVAPPGAASPAPQSPSSAPAPSPTASAPRPSPTATPRPTATRPAAPPTPPARPKPTPTRAPAAPALVPVVGVTDGDTIKVRVGGTTERVRVIGIDTPELRDGECYAQQAASRMQSLVQSRSVRLVRDPSQDDRDRYDRLLRHVHLADGRSVGLLLVQGGFAEEYTYDTAYAGQAAHRKAEAAAKSAGRGIWSSGCLAPPAAPAPAPGGGGASSCSIKGNIASDGEKIYHVPGQRYYDVTKIDEGKGERWFCSESDAVAAGWRAAKV